VLDGLIAHVENNVVIAAALGTLINLCASEKNALHFMASDGINYLATLLQNPDVVAASRVTVCRLLRNIASEGATAVALVRCQEIDDVITALLINAEYATELFYEVCKFITTFLVHLPQEAKCTLMSDLCSHNLFNILIDALEMDYELDLDTNAYITIINAEIACIINFFVSGTQSAQLKAHVMDTADIETPEAFIPAKLVQPAFVTPSPQLTYYCCSILFHTCDSPAVQRILIETGAVSWLLEGKWFSNTNTDEVDAADTTDVRVDDNSIALACGVLLKFLQVWYTEHAQRKVVVDWDLRSAQPLINLFIDWVAENRLRNAQLPPSQHLQQTLPKLQQFMQAVPALLKKYK
jgi:hypothetical protein